MAGVAIGYPAEFGGGPVRYLRTIVLAKWPLSVGPKKLLSTWANWARQLHSNAEANRTLLAGEIGPQ
jgi:hypothetical protein